MKTFAVSYQQREIVYLEAEDEDEAQEKVEEMFSNGDMEILGVNEC